MEGQADEQRSPRSRLRRHGVALLLAASAVAVAVFCKVAQADGLTAYIVFLSFLAASAVARRAGRLVRLPELGWGFLVGGAVFLAWFSLTVVGAWYLFSWDDEEEVWFYGTVVCLWLIWAFHWRRKATFWPQLALAAGLCWGPLAIVVVFWLLWHGPSEVWDDHFIIPIVRMALVAPPAAFLAWVPFRAGWRIWRRLRTRPNRDAPPADRLGARARRFFAWPHADPTARPWQFTLRRLLLMMLVVSIGLGWFRLKQEQARKIRRAIEVLNTCGNASLYPEDENFGPHWLRASIGDELYTWIARGSPTPDWQTSPGRQRIGPRCMFSRSPKPQSPTRDWRTSGACLSAGSTSPPRRFPMPAWRIWHKCRT